MNLEKFSKSPEYKKWEEVMKKLFQKTYSSEIVLLHDSHKL